MLNGLLDSSEFGESTNLQEAMTDERRALLAKHAKKISQQPTCVCFQCGMINYPDGCDAIPVQGIAEKRDCRAYRVFEHYISELEERIGDDETAFLCEPIEGIAAASRVFACSFCKKLCASTVNGQTLYYQCMPNELDLFDGYAADGSYRSIGIGEQQPAELAALTVADRLALSVLKMADATFKAYSGPGYTHMHGGGVSAQRPFLTLPHVLLSQFCAARRVFGLTRAVFSPPQAAILSHPSMSHLITSAHLSSIVSRLAFPAAPRPQRLSGPGIAADHTR